MFMVRCVTSDGERKMCHSMDSETDEICNEGRKKRRTYYELSASCYN
ncbi:unnamed protein product [Spodoptera exigua]|nr:unnamed protein product [Spodoptera exigua]